MRVIKHADCEVEFVEVNLLWVEVEVGVVGGQVLFSELVGDGLCWDVTVVAYKIG